MNLRKVAAGLALIAVTGVAQAKFILNIVQNGPDVVMSGNGSIDITGMPTSLSPGSCGTNNGVIGASVICIGSGALGVRVPGAFPTALTGITSGPLTWGTASTGPQVFLLLTDLYLPLNYVSGSGISNSVTFSGTTLTAMGLPTGTTKTLNLASGDSIVINFGFVPPVTPTATAIPTLSEWGLIFMSSILALFGMAGMRRRQR